tara:strand:- start:1620 stop:2159 length:540 start_codon:yes stop_codon:yes gene_type:complete
MAQQVFKITDDNKVKLLGSREGYNQLKSITIANLHSADTNVTLYLASQVGDDITDSGTDANEADNSATTSSVTLTVDGTAATSDTFLNEQVFKSDGTLFGTCTARNSNTEIVFGGGLSQTLANNDSLFVGTRYHILAGSVIPTRQTLILQGNEISFDNLRYAMYIKLGGATPVDVIINS